MNKINKIPERRLSVKSFLPSELEKSTQLFGNLRRKKLGLDSCEFFVSIHLKLYSLFGMTTDEANH